MIQELKKISPEQWLIFDIETVPGLPSFDDLSPMMQELWLDKHKKLASPEEDPSQSYFRLAGLSAEFGRVVCICIAAFYNDKDQGRKLRIKSFANQLESVILNEFADFLHAVRKKNQYMMSGHNIKEYDVPFLCRRMLIHGIEIPELIDVSGRKPWEMNMLDTLQIWKFSDSRNYTSLKLMATLLGIDSPKDDIDGSKVASVFYHEHDLPRIVHYCRKDVLTVAQLLLKLKKEPLISDNEITYSE